MAVYMYFLLFAASLVQCQPSGKKLAIMGGSMGDNADVWTKFIQWSVSVFKSNCLT